MGMTEQELQQYHAMHRHTWNISKTADVRARRAARQCGLRACKSRQWRHLNNYGGYQLIDERNVVVAGVNFELNAEDVIEFCKGWGNRKMNRCEECNGTPRRRTTCKRCGSQLCPDCSLLHRLVSPDFKPEIKDCTEALEEVTENITLYLARTDCTQSKAAGQ